MKSIFAAILLLAMSFGGAEAKTRRHVQVATQEHSACQRDDRYACHAWYEPTKRSKRVVHVVRTAKRTIERAVHAPVEVLDKAQRAYRFFISRGYSPEAAAGICGNLKAESNFNVHDRGDGGRARGLAQWHPDRFAGLRRLARETGRDVHDFDLQLEYIDVELRRSETLAHRRLREAASVEQGTAAFVHYERPQFYTERRPERAHSFRQRLAFARLVHDRFGRAAGWQP